MSNGAQQISVNYPTGFGPGGPLPIPSPWVSYGTYIGYATGGVLVGNPNGGDMGPGTINTVNLFINGLSISPGNYLPISGGTIGGNLTINGNLTVVGTSDGIKLDMGTF